MADPKRDRASYLTVQQQYELECAAFIVNNVFHHLSYGLYQVGSTLSRPDWRDVDLRYITQDSQFDALFGYVDSPMHTFLNTVISEWFERRTGLPVDFQFQRQTEANAKYSIKDGHKRNAVGIIMEIAFNEHRSRSEGGVR